MNRYKQRDEVLSQMGFPSYDDYLRSPLWARIRARVMKSCGELCICGQSATEIHHRSYKRRYMEGRGKVTTFLTAICRKCHHFIEFDEEGKKTPLGLANTRLEKLARDAEDAGIRRPGKRIRSKKAWNESTRKFDRR